MTIQAAITSGTGSKAEPLKLLDQQDVDGILPYLKRLVREAEQFGGRSWPFDKLIGSDWTQVTITFSRQPRVKL